MDNLKCLFDHVSAHASVDFIDACERQRVMCLHDCNKNQGCWFLDPLKHNWINLGI